MTRVFTLFTLTINGQEGSFLADVTTIATDSNTLLQWQEKVGIDVFLFELECEYGTHDFSGFSDLNLPNLTVIHLGYTGDGELDESVLNEVMYKHRDEWVKHLGAAKVSPVYVRAAGDESGLAELYNNLFPHLNYLS